MKNLGGRPRPFDNRDISLHDLGAGSYPPIPVAYKADVSKIRRLFQRSWPACGAHAGATLKAIQEIQDVGLTDGCSPRCLWRFIKEIDGVPSEWGTDMRSVLKALTSRGVCKYSTAPNPDYDMPLWLYSNLAITQEIEDEAQEMILQAYGFLDSNFTILDLQRAIYANKIVLLLIRCDDGFFGTKIPTFVSKTYGHFVVAYGYDESRIFILDSTEADPELSEKEILNKYRDFIVEVGTAVDVSTEKVRALMKQKSILTRIVELYQVVVGLVLKIRFS